VRLPILVGAPLGLVVALRASENLTFAARAERRAWTPPMIIRAERATTLTQTYGGTKKEPALAKDAGGHEPTLARGNPENFSRLEAPATNPKCEICMFGSLPRRAPSGCLRKFPGGAERWLPRTLFSCVPSPSAQTRTYRVRCYRILTPTRAKMSNRSGRWVTFRDGPRRSRPNFECGAFNHSATSPHDRGRALEGRACI
jgi:hypothetical protein